MRECMYEEKVKTYKDKMTKFLSSVCVLPIDKDGNIVVIYKCNLPLGKVQVELPMADVEYGEKPEDAARRALLYEIGYSVEKVKLLEIYNSQNSIIKVVYLFSAVNVTDEKNEYIFKLDNDIKIVTPNRLLELIENGQFAQPACIKAVTKFYLKF